MRLSGYVILTISYINHLRNVNGYCLAIDEVRWWYHPYPTVCSTDGIHDISLYVCVCGLSCNVCSG